MRLTARALLSTIAIAAPALGWGAHAVAQTAPQTAPAAAPTRSVQPASAPSSTTPAAGATSPAAAAATTTSDTQPAQQSVLGELDLGAVLRQGTGPITSDQAAAQAAKTAPTVKRARAQSERARAGAELAWIGVYPRLELSASYTRLSEHDPPEFGTIPANSFSVGFPPEDLVLAPTETIPDIFSLKAQLAYPVSDVFLKVLPSHGAAARSVDAQNLSTKADQASIALAAREAYYNYARARATLEVARSGLTQTEAQRRDVDSLVAAGTLARVESMRASAVVAAAQVAVARAEGGVAVARTALRSLLHEEGDQEIGIAEDFTQPPTKLAETKEALLAHAMQHRSELAAVRTMIEVHDKTRDANGADRFPKLSVVGAYEFDNPNQRVDPFNREFNGSWSVSGVLSWSPNDYAGSHARMSEAGAARESSFAELAALEDALRREVAEAYAAYVAASQAMEAALTGIAAAEESHRVRREQFRAGAAVATDVVDAEAELRRARLELVNAAIDARIARARLDRAVER
jgi:outer membrane protein